LKFHKAKSPQTIGLQAFQKNLINNQRTGRDSNPRPPP
jgi:hypothetical protein